jgi:hypothetical protein
LPSNTLFITLLSSILIVCPNHCNLLLLMSATISGSLYSSCSSCNSVMNF